LVYDPDKRYRKEDYLSDYARLFNSVEVDQWFWSLFSGGPRLPEPSTVRTYAESVPDDFVFVVKAPNALTLTHAYGPRTGPAGRATPGPSNPHFLSLDLLRRFLDLLRPLGPKLGPVMFQFEYLSRKKMGSAGEFLDRFGEFIDRAPSGFLYGLETRNPNYLTPEFFEFLRGRGLGYVGLEGYYMPRLADVFARLRPRLERFCVLRLHGSGREEIEQAAGRRWDKIVTLRTGEIQALAGIVGSNLRAGVLTYVNVNNHFEGSAPLTIERLFAALEEGNQG
jgi:uncharacterized protein YecE (DUF72 family)